MRSNIIAHFEKSPPANSSLAVLQFKPWALWLLRASGFLLFPNLGIWCFAWVCQVEASPAVVMILSLIGGDRCCWRLAAFGWSSSCFSIIIRQRAAPLVITSFPSLFPYTVFALKTSNRGLIFFHTIFIPFMTLAQWHKTFMAPFHTLISDVIFSLFCLDWILTWLCPVVFSLERRTASIQQVTWAAFTALVLSPNDFCL